jgi:DMSO/TMAO reductase YedYZ molybdopterin-dependent catalytic subunit
VKAAATEHPSVQDIVATQRAKQGYAEPTPTPAAQSATSNEVAELQTDVGTPTDPLAEFNQLEAEGHLTPVLTATDDFYHVSKNLSDPEVDEKKWSLKVTGLVDKELELSYDDLVARATQTKITTLCCISNELNGDLISTAQWQGFSLADLLNEAGVKPEAVDIKLHAADDYEDSFPVARGMDPDTIVVTGMNGEPLRDDHGYPCRLIVPGIFGMKNVKWLDRIELVDENFMGYWQTRGWSDTAENQIWGRIDYPDDGDKLDAGQITAAGVASAGDRGIARVEVTLDDGKTWTDATLEPSINPPFTWVRWSYTFNGTPGKYTLKIRPTDGTGQVATEVGRPPLPDGATGWPRRKFEVKG